MASLYPATKREAIVLLKQKTENLRIYLNTATVEEEEKDLKEEQKVGDHFLY